MHEDLQGCREGAPKAGLSNRRKVVSKGWARSGAVRSPPRSGTLALALSITFPRILFTKSIKLIESRRKWQGLVGTAAVVVGRGKVGVTH